MNKDFKDNYFPNRDRMGNEIIMDRVDFGEVEGEIDADFKEHQEKQTINVKAAARNTVVIKKNNKVAVEENPTNAVAAKTADFPKYQCALIGQSK